MLYFRWDDYGIGTYPEKIRVSADGLEGKFYQILITDPDERDHFVEAILHLNNMLPKITTIIGTCNAPK